MPTVLSVQLRLKIVLLMARDIKLILVKMDTTRVAILALLTLSLVPAVIKPRLVLLRKFRQEQHLRFALAKQLPVLVMLAVLKLVKNKAKRPATAHVLQLRNVAVVAQAAKNVLTVHV